jgi:hypothetical protein
MLASLTIASSAHAARWVRGPYLQDLDSRHVAILGELDAAHGVRLEVARGGETGVATTKVETSPRDTSHEIAVSGLEPATTYAWTLTTDDGLVERGTFTTAPDDDRPFSFILYGDNRTNPYAHTAVVAAIRRTPSDFLVHTGDMVYDGSQASNWSEFFQIERDLLRERCLYPAIGNHEIAMPTSDGALRYARLFRVPAPPGASERWYTVRWGSARFFVLDSQDEFTTTERAWLDSALAAARSEAGLIWRFVVLHHGPFSSGLHGPNEAMHMARVPELLRANGVDLIFSGHDHTYERGEVSGLRYVVSGGGGAPLYREFRGHPGSLKFEPTYHFARVEVSREKVVLSAMRHDLSLIERCDLAAGRGSGWSCGAVPPPVAGGSLTATTPPAQTAPSPPAKKSCGCGVVGLEREWLGLVVAGLLASAVMLRRRGREP